MSNTIDKKALLLTNSYQAISFLSERKIYKLLYKDKIEIVSNWDNRINWGKEQIFYPAVVRLKHSINVNIYKFTKPRFSRKALMRRDNYCCQYCGDTLTPSQVSIDHIIPKSKGGKTTYLNCVISCKYCNMQKGDSSLHEVNMKLLNNPTYPNFSLYNNLECKNYHPDWYMYI